MFKQKYKKPDPERHSSPRGQSAIEYLVLLSAVAVAVLVGFYTYLPRVSILAGDAFNQLHRNIVGNKSFTPVDYNGYP